MAYQIDRFNGTKLVDIQDGTLDTTLDIKLVGKNYAGYGEVQNENFLHLLEHFANSSPPIKAISGQIWFDSGSSKLKFYNGAGWKTTGGAEVGPTPPTGLANGDFWYNDRDNQLYAWNNNEFFLIGPQGTPEFGNTQFVSTIVKDIYGVSHPIVKSIIGDQTVSVFSKDEFILATSPSTNLIAGFSLIKKGITMINTPADGITTTDHYFWGTASNSLKLGGIDASEYLTKLLPKFTSLVEFSDEGFLVGDDQDLGVFIEDGSTPVISSRLGNGFFLRVMAGTTEHDVAKFEISGITPGTDSTYMLGSSSKKWSALYANSVIGNLTGDSIGAHKGNLLANNNTVVFDSVTQQFAGSFKGNLIAADTSITFNAATKTFTGTLSGTADNANKLQVIVGSTAEYRSASVSNQPNTIAVRTDARAIVADLFQGVATHSEQLKVNDTYYSATVEASVGTISIAARSAAGELTAVKFNGTATAAQYADLAERYEADEEISPGTVVVFGGDKEITASSFDNDHRVAGVISTDPAYLMNDKYSNETHPPVALRGRVPVKVIGPVRKGDLLVTSSVKGHAMAGGVNSNPHCVFAKSLVDDNDSGERVIEAVIL